MTERRAFDAAIRCRRAPAGAWAVVAFVLAWAASLAHAEDASGPSRVGAIVAAADPTGGKARKISATSMSRV